MQIFSIGSDILVGNGLSICWSRSFCQVFYWGNPITLQCQTIIKPTKNEKKKSKKQESEVTYTQFPAVLLGI